MANVYHPDRLKIITPCTTVTGTVAVVRSEADGDVHFNLDLDSQYANLINDQNRSQEHGQLVIEIVPADRPGCAVGAPPKAPIGTYDYGTCSGAGLTTPAISAHVSVTGPYVLDTAHGWMEIHPAWTITAVSGTAVPGTAVSGQPAVTSAPATTRGPSPASTSPAATSSPATSPATNAAPGPTAGCNATISNASPADNSTVTVRITSAPPNTAASATAHYKTTNTTNSTTTDSSGAGSIDFKISRATVGYQVVIDITAGGSSCQTSFTPR